MSNNNGAVAAIRCYANDDYVFSFCSYQNYVSFYLRHPALNRWAGLHQTATKRFEEVNQNPAGETIIKIRNQEVANDLADWLYALL